MAIDKVTVLGCGLMGSGIAQVCAHSGRDVTMVEVSEDLLKKGMSTVEKNLGRLVDKGKLSGDEREKIVARLHGSTDLESAAGSDIVIEAIIENLDEKRKTYSRLDLICRPETIFASNTSSLSITEMMTSTSAERQRRFIGMHFFNPVPVMKLVEVVRTILTDRQVFESAVAFGREIGKVPVQTSDRTGFIVNRLLVPYLLDSVRALEEGVGSIVDIDNGMKLGCGYPMGPFALGDFVGLDTTYY
ncbi:MAG: 3-hydroxyacyl-CoA dehydrogenase family protein, partial [Blastocatellia bacterium]